MMLGIGVFNELVPLPATAAAADVASSSVVASIAITALALDCRCQQKTTLNS